MDLRIPTEQISAYSRMPLWQPGTGQQPPTGIGTGTDRVATGTEHTSTQGVKKECQACKNRKYKDASNDPTVSFQTPTKLSPAAAEVAVRAHEEEHVVHEQANARSNGRKVVSQEVTIHYAICPECGRLYVAGGTTTTVTRPADSASYGSSRQHATGGLVDARV